MVKIPGTLKEIQSIPSISVFFKRLEFRDYRFNTQTIGSGQITSNEIHDAKQNACTMLDQKPTTDCARVESLPFLPDKHFKHDPVRFRGLCTRPQATHSAWRNVNASSSIDWGPLAVSEMENVCGASENVYARACVCLRVPLSILDCMRICLCWW